MVTAKRIRVIARKVISSFLFIALVLICTNQARYFALQYDLLPTAQAANYTPETSTGFASDAVSQTITTKYCSEIVSQNNFFDSEGTVETELTFDNSWFSEKSSTYNHDLATTCSILAAICNSESQYYNEVLSSTAYVEETLAALGFTNIVTDSYQLRSHTLDQIGAFIAGSHDVAAYAFATKQFTDEDGTQKTLVFVGIRGSYGTEWLSNFKFLSIATTNSDHRGFKEAEEEVYEALAEYLQTINADSNDIKFLITGHSRGGAIANLLAADLDTLSMSEQNGLSKDDIYAYTFASPRTTRSGDRKEASYNNIFNVVNPADIVPQMPLASWDYGRYGTMVSLPKTTDSSYESLYASVQARHAENTGYKNPCSVSSLRALDSFDDEVNASVPTIDSLATLNGLFSVAQAITSIDYSMAMYAHYPDSYIAWMQSINSSSLTFREHP